MMYYDELGTIVTLRLAMLAQSGLLIIGLSNALGMIRTLYFKSTYRVLLGVIALLIAAKVIVEDLIFFLEWKEQYVAQGSFLEISGNHVLWALGSVVLFALTELLWRCRPAGVGGTH